ncbi:MAG: Verru_Chthon cassette protein C [Chthoniobacter sp.]|nr:Verru_Chthon cassette protein C [Chthoniobacter sp.]
MTCICSPPRRHAGFTLVEVMVSTAILMLLLIILFAVTNQTSNSLRYTRGKIEQFREARAAFETITSKVSQATLNTYWDYGFDSSGLPSRYERRSELRFISGQQKDLLGTGTGGSRLSHAVFFHAPLGLVDAASPQYHGLEGLLNIWGYYVELNSDKNFRPAFINSAPVKPPERFRFRLMELMLPSERLSTYGYTTGISGGIPSAVSYQGKDWFRDAVSGTPAASRPVAENIVALIVTPRLSKRDEQEIKGSSTELDTSPLAPRYTYDSALTMNDGQTTSDPRTNPKNQLPPILQITMVAIDEVSAARLNLTATSGDVFKLSNKFADTSKYTKDLVINPTGAVDASLENALISKRVSYRVFTTNVPIRAAKWSRAQVN